MLDEVADLDQRRSSAAVGRPPAVAASASHAPRLPTGGVIASGSDGCRRAPSSSWYSQQRTSWPGATGSSSGWTSVASATSSSIARQAARREPAARRQVDQVRHVARDDRQLVLDSPDDRDRADQAARVRVLRLAEQRRDVGLLDDLAGVHDRHPVAHLGDDAEVVGDEDDRGAGLVAQVAHQVEDLGLDRHVERGRRLVGDEQLGLAGERHRDHHPLRHAARHLVRVGLRAAAAGSGMPTIRSSSSAARAGRPCASCRDGARGPRRSGGRRPDRVQRRLGCWKIMLIRSPRILRISSSDSLSRSWPSNRTSPRLDPAGLGDEPHDRQAGHALAAAGLADETHDLAAVDVEVDAVDGADDAVARVERGPQALDLEQRALATLVLRPPPRCRDELLDDVPVDRRVEQRLGASRSRRCVRRAAGRARRSPVEPRVERVAQAVAEQVEGEHRERDGEARGEDDVRRVEQLVALAARSSSPTRAFDRSPVTPMNESAAISSTAPPMPSVPWHDERRERVRQDPPEQDARAPTRPAPARRSRSPARASDEHRRARRRARRPGSPRCRSRAAR